MTRSEIFQQPLSSAAHVCTLRTLRHLAQMMAAREVNGLEVRHRCFEPLQLKMMGFSWVLAGF